MSTSDDEPIDPFEAHFHREPLPGAGIKVIVLCDGQGTRSDEVARSLEDLILARGRDVETVVIPVAGRGFNRALQIGLEGATAPLVLITSARAPWSSGHLDPLLTSIDHCDHAIGRRTSSLVERARATACWLPWRVLFAVPVVDVHSPCRLHRLEKL